MHKKLISELLLATKNTGVNISKKKVCTNTLLLRKSIFITGDSRMAP